MAVVMGVAMAAVGLVEVVGEVETVVAETVAVAVEAVMVVAAMGAAMVAPYLSRLGSSARRDDF